MIYVKWFLVQELTTGNFADAGHFFTDKDLFTNNNYIDATVVWCAKWQKLMKKIETIDGFRTGIID